VTLESIAWRGVHVELPDTIRTVLVYGPQLEADDEVHDDDQGGHVWLGYFNAGDREWYDTSNAPLEHITHWADLPKGADPP